MATTDAKPGFRLPWSADRGETGSPADGAAVDPLTGYDPDPSHAQEHETPQMIDAPPATDQPAPAAVRRPNKFMADLTKAMQVAAETARADTVSRYAAEAKAHVENIHAGTVAASTELRKKADDDVATIRDWSKTEIARIREETDERIAHRKNVLEREVEAHAAEIESRIQRVQGRVASFETQMTEFFDRLLAEDDPTRFAAMAESLPEPPLFDFDDAWELSASDGATAEVASPAVSDPAVDIAESGPSDADNAPILESTADVAAEMAIEPPADASDERLDGGDLFGIRADEPSPDAGADPRLAALAFDEDFAAAEAEAADFTPDGAGSDDEIPVIADDALAARLAGLVPDTEEAAPDSVATRVVVTGLVSVASIAGFKRHMSRLTGVQSVGVSSGPDGEFVFAIVHSPELGLRDAISTLPGFQARITAESDGQLVVAARDPETGG